MLNKYPYFTGKKNFFKMAKLTDSDLMPQGKYKGQTMENVPYWHLLWLYDQPFCRRDVREYIDDNRDVLELEQKRDIDRRDKSDY